MHYRRIVRPPFFDDNLDDDALVFFLVRDLSRDLVLVRDLGLVCALGCVLSRSLVRALSSISIIASFESAGSHA